MKTPRHEGSRTSPFTSTTFTVILAFTAGCSAVANDTEMGSDQGLRTVGPNAAAASRVPAQVPDDLWREISDAGGGDPTNVVLFRLDDENSTRVGAIDIREAFASDGNPTIWELEHPKAAAYHRCLEVRDRRAADQRIRLTTDLTEREEVGWTANVSGPDPIHQNQGVVMHADCRYTTVYRHDLRWSSPLVERVAWSRPTVACADGLPVAWDAVHSPSDERIAWVDANLGYETIWAVDPLGRAHAEGWSATNAQTWGAMQLTDNPSNGNGNIKHPTWSPARWSPPAAWLATKGASWPQPGGWPNGPYLVVSSSLVNPTFHLELIPDTRRAYDQFPRVDVRDRRRNDVVYLTGVGGPSAPATHRPVWVKYRDMPTDDAECQQAIGGGG